MKKFFSYVTILLFSALLFLSCKSTTEPVDITTGEGEATLTGTVIDNTTDSPVAGAAVTIFTGTTQIGKTTDENGRFGAVIEIEKTKDVTVITTLSGYYVDTSTATVTADEETDILIKLQKRTVGTDVSGEPASIVLISTSAQSIGVKESGSVESALVTFEVQDSSGNAININHSVWINFRLGQAPGGGEFINPTSIKTNASGRAIVSISSGYKAGVVQFEALINYNGKTILSKPVNIAIHGGHPDKTHFTVATQYLNIPGWDQVGFIDIINVIVGDKYANPVKPLTAVYFTTTGGVIEGSALTGDLGTGGAKLLSGNPRPVHPVYGPGFATVYATTADENYNEIIDSCLVLFSGWPIITAEPVDFGNVPHLGKTTVRYTIKDRNGNPIAPGNKVSVVVTEGDGIGVSGDVNFETMDTQDKNAINYYFIIKDIDSDEYLGPRAVSIRITVSGPNGYAHTSVYGTADF